MTVQRLFYSSRIADEHASRGAAMAREIAQASAVRNAASGLTGTLAYIDGHFIQVLEGNLKQVEETFERICCDFRHRELKLLDYHTAPSRLFSEWSMASLVEEDATIGQREALSEVRILATLNAREAIARMRQLLALQDRAVLTA